MLTSIVYKHVHHAPTSDLEGGDGAFKFEMRGETYLRSNDRSKSLNVGIPKSMKVVCHEAKEIDIGFHSLGIKTITMLSAVYRVFGVESVLLSARNLSNVLTRAEEDVPPEIPIVRGKREANSILAAK